MRWAWGVVFAAACGGGLLAQDSQLANKQSTGDAVGQAIDELPDEFKPPQRWALIIAASDYVDDNIPDLPQCANDGKVLRSLLTNPQHGMFPKENVRLLLDADVTREKVIEGLEWLSRNAKPDDLAVVYFTGHGATDRRGDAYWVMQKTRVNSLRATALPELDVTDLLGDIPSSRLLVLIDACFSAATANLPTKSVVNLQKLYPKFDGKGRVAITASNGQQLSLTINDTNHPGFGYSVFTWHVKEALEGKADTDGDGVLTVSELWRHVSEQVPITAKQYQGDMTPQLKGQIGGKFLLAVHADRLASKQELKRTTIAMRQTRLKKLRSLALDEKLTIDQFREGRRLLEADPSKLSKTDEASLAEFVNVLEEKLPPEKLARALQLATLITTPATSKPSPRPSPSMTTPSSRAATPPGHTTNLSSSQLRLDYIPESTDALFVARPAAFFEVLRTQPANQRILDDFFSELRKAGFEDDRIDLIQDIEQITLAVNSARMNMGPEAIVFRFVSQASRDDVFGMMFTDSDRDHREYRGRKYSVGQNMLAVWLADEYTFVMGLEDSVKSMIQNGPKTLSSLAKSAYWDEIPKNFVIAGIVDAQSISKSIPPEEVALAFAPPFKAFFDNATHHLLWATMEGQSLKIQHRQFCQSNDDTAGARMAMDYLKGTLFSMLLASKQSNGGFPAIDFLTQLVDSMETKSQGGEVVTTASGTVTPETITAITQSILLVQQTAKSAEKKNNLREIGLAFHNYESLNGHFPAAVLVDPKRRQARSWRVEILPQLGYQALYDQYRKNEPWDSPANLKVLAQMPDVYSSPDAEGHDRKPDHTSILLPSGGGMMFDGQRETKMRDIVDGTSNTIMCIDHPTKTVPWTKPEDLPFPTKYETRLESLRSLTTDAYIVSLADGAVAQIVEGANAQTVMFYLTIAGGEEGGQPITE